MKCILCGTDNRPEANRCKGCGASLTSGKEGGLVGRGPSPTVLESPGTDAACPPDSSGGGRKTRLVGMNEVDQGRGGVPLASGQPGRRKTVYVPPDREGEAAIASVKPKLVGFLVSFTWDRSGQAFQFREGKTVFGSEPGCDAVLPADRAMSGKHFAVMCRTGEVKIRDLDSTNATTVDGVEIWGDSASAKHGTAVRAGDTVFQVVLIPGPTS